jgi:type I restriction enzyme S subunit/type I restriction enzyme M protein
LIFGGISLAVVSTVNLSDLARHNRIDADRYHTNFLRLETRLRRIPAARKLSLLISAPVRTGYTPAVREIREDDERVCFVKTDTLREGLIGFDNSDYLPGRVLSNRDYLRHQEVIVTIIGAHHDIVGRAAVYLEHYPKCVVNQNIAVIRPDVRQLNPFYLEVFLNCKYGRRYLWMLSRQTEQVNLNCREVEELLVPLFDSTVQDRTGSLAKQSIQLIETAKALYSQAENLFLEELGLKGFKPKYELSFSTNLSKAFKAHRVDAEHFQPAFDQVTKKVISYKNGYASLLTCVESVRPDFDPGGYPDTSFKYVELADIDMSIGIIRSASETRGEEAPSRARRILKKGDVIVSSVEGSLEKVALVDGEYEDSLASTGFFQLRARGMNPEVLLVLSKSIVLQAQLKRECAGTILTAVPNESLKRIIIPILPLGVQQSIAELIRQSHEARKRAKELLEEAKSKVENLIEGKA